MSHTFLGQCLEKNYQILLQRAETKMKLLQEQKPGAMEDEFENLRKRYLELLSSTPAVSGKPEGATVVEQGIQAFKKTVNTFEREISAILAREEALTDSLKRCEEQISSLLGMMQEKDRAIFERQRQDLKALFEGEILEQKLLALLKRIEYIKHIPAGDHSEEKKFFIRREGVNSC